jgi:hypothetical protein
MPADEKLQPFGRNENASPVEKRAGEFFADARPTVGLTDGDVAAIARRLSRPPRVRRRLVLWPALAGAAVLLVTGSVMAVVVGWRPRLPFMHQAAPPAPSQPPSSPTRRHPPIEREVKRAVEAPPSPAAPVPGPSEAPSPATVTPPSMPRSAARRPVRPEAAAPPTVAPVAAPAATPSEGALSVEARSLSDALARWRRDGNAEAALAHLREHDRRFPGGALAVESKVARVEILLAVGRRAEALTTLDTLNLQGLPRARELETVRGELRMQAGRCADARTDFAQVLHGTPRGRPNDEFDTRASRGLTKCP